QVVLTSDRDHSVWSDYFTPEKMGVGTFGLIASTAAYTDGKPWLDEVMATLDRNRQVLSDLVAAMLPRAVMSPQEATYLAWIDLSGYGRDRPGEYLLDTARVGLSEGVDFGPGGEGHVRLNFATDGDILVEIVNRIARIIEG